MTDAQAYELGEAIRGAIDDAMDDDVSPNEIKEEIAFQVENYDWPPA